MMNDDEQWFISIIHCMCHFWKSPSVNVPTQKNFSAWPICRFTAITPSLRKIILFGPLTNRSSGGNASSNMLIWDRRLFLWSNRLKYRLVFDNDFVWQIAASSTSISRMDKVWLSLIRFARCIRFESPFQHAVICKDHYRWHGRWNSVCLPTTNDIYYSQKIPSPVVGPASSVVQK